MTESFNRKLGRLAQNVSGTGSITTNASTASAWQTARTITLGGDLSGSVSLDGSSNVSLTATVSGDSIVLGTDTTGNYVATVTAGSGITVSGSGTETAAVTVSIDSTVVTLSGTQTLTNKTLTTPVISSISNTGTLTLPVATDTLVGRATTDTLTNKTIALGSNTVSGTLAEFNSAMIDADFTSLAGSETLTNKTISGVNNTLSNIGNSSLSNSSITINGTSVSLGGTRTLVTDDIAEDGSPVNLWYTDARTRSAISVTDAGGDGSLGYDSGTGVITYTGPSATEVRAHFSAGTGVTITTGQIAIGQAVGTTNDVTFAGVTADAVRVGVTTAGEIDTTTGNLTLDSAGGTTTIDDNAAVTGNLQIDGNLTVSGTTVTMNTTTLSVEDNMIYLNSGSAVANPDLGFAGNYNDGTYRHAGLFRDATDGVFKFFHQYVPEPDASPYIDITHGTFALASIQASSFTGSVTGNVTGNASTATAWQTARTLSLTGDVTGTSAAFDGSGNISISTTIAADSVALGTDTTGNYVASITNGSYITGGNGGSEGATLTLAVDATSANTASKVVARDASGNFAAGTITAALSGNATTATTLQTARNINGVSFNGSADITVADSTKLPLSGGTLSGNLGVTGYIDVTGILYHRTTIQVLNKAENGWVTWATRNTAGADSVIDLSNIGTFTSTAQTFNSTNSTFNSTYFTVNSSYITIGNDAADAVGISNNSMYVYNGSVGIGTTSPSNLLHLKASTNPVIRLEGASDSGYVDYNGTRLQLSAGGGAVYLVAGNTERARITSGGDVLINKTASDDTSAGFRFTTSNYASFVRSGNPPLYINRLTSDGDLLEFARDSSIKATLGITSNALTFGVNSSERVRIDSSGNLGIGTTSPGSRLSVVGSTNGTLPLVDLTASGTDAFMRGVRMLNSGMVNGSSLMYAVGRSDNARNMGQFYFAYVGDGSTSNRISMGLHSVDDVLNILGTGNVGIGTTSPAEKLHVSGAVRVGDYFKLESAATYMGMLGFNRNTTNGAIYNSSYGAYQIHNGSGDLYIQVYNSAGSQVTQHVFNNSGNVGIGTTSPSEKLHVVGNIRVGDSANRSVYFHTSTNWLYYLNGSGNDFTITDYESVQFFKAEYASGGTTKRSSMLGALYVINTGNVGIGTSSPVSKLHLNGGKFIFTSDDGGYGQLQVNAPAGGEATILLGSTGSGQNAGGYTNAGVIGIGAYGGSRDTLILGTGYSSGTLFLKNGNAGIGVSNPTKKLHISSGSNQTLSLDSTQRYLLELMRDGTSEWWLSVDSGHLIFHENAVGDQITFNAGGQVVFPSMLFTARDTGTTGNGIFFYGVTGDNPGSFNHTAIVERLWGTSDQSELLLFKGNDPDTSTIHDRVRIAATGRIVFHSTTVYQTYPTYISDAGTGNIAGSGYIYGNDLVMTGNVTAYSDVRLKTNITDITDALEKVLKIRGVTYNRTDVLDTKKRYAGVIAQEVEQVLPEVVSEDDEGMKNVAYGNMIGLLIEAIKEQQQEIELLKKHIKNSQ